MSPFMACLGYHPPLFDFQEDEVVGLYVKTINGATEVMPGSRQANWCRTSSPSYWPGQRVWLSSKDLPLQMNFRQHTLSDTSWMSWFLVDFGGEGQEGKMSGGAL